MLFYNNMHKKFYYDSISKCPVEDTYHQSLFYTLGIDNDCRNHISDLYDFKHQHIKLDGLEQPWQTTGSMKSTLLAFNLYNGYTDENNTMLSTPYELFACEYSSFFIEAIKLRFPEFHRSRNKDMEKSR